MAEKNTHSILETIKKKMQKFDQKTDKAAKISDVSSEFEYIAPTKRAAAPAVEEKKEETGQPEKIVPKFSDDLGIEEAKKPAAPIPAAPINSQPRADGKLDDFNMDDLDIDDESTKKIPAANNAPIAPALDNIASAIQESFEEDDIEDYEDEVEFREEEGEIEEEAVAAEQPLDLENQDELSFGEEEPSLELPHEDELAFENEEQQEEEDLALPEEEAQPQSAEAQTLPQEEAAQEDDLNFDDLEHEEESEATTTTTSITDPTPAQKSEKQAEKKEDGEFDDEELAALEREVEEQQKKQVEVKKPATPSEEIDLEFEKELMGLKPEKIDEVPVAQQAAPVQQVAPQPQPMPVQQPVQAPQAAAIPDLDQQDVEEILFSEEEHSELDQEPAAQAQPQYNMPQQMPAAKPNQKIDDSLIYNSTVMQTTESIKKLIDAKNVVAGISSFSQSPALSELAVQLMEPKLERWLNDNLPHVVEKIVREEIKRIIPKD